MNKEEWIEQHGYYPQILECLTEECRVKSFFNDGGLIICPGCGEKGKAYE